LAAEHVLADLSSNPRFGIVLDKAVLALSSPVSLNEEKLENVRHDQEQENPNIADDQVIIDGEEDAADGSDE
jgi:hypothetical protein